MGQIAFNPVTGEYRYLDQSGQWQPAQRAQNPQTGETLVFDGEQWKPATGQKLPEADWDRVNQMVEQAPGERFEDAILADFGLTRDQFNAYRSATGKGDVPRSVGGRALDYLSGLTEAAGNAATFGFADEAGAAGAAVAGGDYGATLDTTRARRAEFGEENPIASGVSALAGGLAGVSPLLGVRSGVIQTAAPSYGRAVGGAATAGGVGGFGDAEGGIDDRLGGAAIGGGIGAGLGAVAPLAFAGANRAVGTVSRAFGLQNPNEVADDLLTRALTRDLNPKGQDLSDLEAALLASRGTAPQSLMDIAGPNTTRLGRLTTNAPGEASAMADDFLMGRQFEQPERLVDLLRGSMGRPEDFTATIQALDAHRRATARPLYDAAFSQPLPASERLMEIQSLPVVRQALTRGLRTAQVDDVASGRPFSPTDFNVTGFNEAGDPIIDGTFNLRTWDAVKRGLDDILEGYRDKTTGRLVLDGEGRAIENLRRSIVSELDQIGPAEYRAARAAWGGPSASIEATQAGRAFARGDVEGMATRFGAMSPGDQDFFRLGVARQLREMIERGGDGRNQAAAVFGNPAMRRRLQEIFPDQASYNAFLEAIQVENQMSRTARTVLGGSMTTNKAADAEDARNLTDQVLDLGMAAAAGGTPGVIGRVGQMASTRLAGINEPVGTALAKQLFTADPLVHAETMRRLTSRQTNQLLDRETWRRIAASALAGSSNLGAQAAAPVEPR